MVLTKDELIGAFRHEVHILMHLIGKIDRAKLDYRPTPKQRSTIELLRYLSMMGPVMVQATQSGRFDPVAWTEAENGAAARNFDQTVAVIAAQADGYRTLLSTIPDADFRDTVNMFGNPSSRGAFLVNVVLGGCVAYRTQLFLYLKACGREELSTTNLWAGADAPKPM